MLIAVREKKKIKGHFQAHFPSRNNILFKCPSSIMRKGKDLHVVHCAILSSDSITHQTLPGMRKDPHISQMPTVARFSLQDRVMQAVQSAFLDSLRYLNLSVLNRNLYL